MTVPAAFPKNLGGRPKFIGPKQPRVRGRLTAKRPGKTPCPVCGYLFRAETRGGRIQKTCSVECHLKTRRDYTGKANPNYRGANEHICGWCSRRFSGKRPRGRFSGTFCDLKCAAMKARMRYVGPSAFRNSRDLNEPELLEAAEKCGAWWTEAGPLDGWIFHPRIGFMPVEIKNPKRKGTKKEFTPLQKKFFEACTLSNSKYWIWRTVDDVLRDLHRNLP